jgi:predicted amidohydrolase YtcJ
MIHIHPNFPSIIKIEGAHTKQPSFKEFDVAIFQRRFLPVFVLSMLFLSLLILAGCTSTNQGVDETTLPLENTPTTAPAESPEPVSDRSDIPAEVVFDSDHTSNGLTLNSGGDMDTEIVTVGADQEQAFRTGNGLALPAEDGNTVEDWYMQFQVDDALIFAGSPTTLVHIAVEYLDEGTDEFNIQYDALSGGVDGSGRFKDSASFTKTGTGEFKTAVFTLDDAHFANRNNGADFRISDSADGPETIRRVTLTLILPDTEAIQASAEPPSSDHAGVIFHNGVILIMENGETATAIAVKGEHILAVGGDEEVLAYAGSGTTLIDLEGRTLMPGFVDGHSHNFISVWRDDLEAGQTYLLSRGITTAAEMFHEESLMQELQALDEQGNLRMRISLYPTHVDACGGVIGDWYWPDYPPSREPSAMLHIPGIKMFNDGGGCNRAAVSFEYLDGGQGDLYFQADELSAMIIEVQDRGYQVAIHGSGDRAVEVNLDAIEIALDGGPNTFRHRIEHNSLVRDDMLTRYTEIDVVAMIFGFFPACFANSPGYATPDVYQEWEWRWRSLIDSNPDVHFAWHADAPPLGDPDPMRHLYGFVTRRDMGDNSKYSGPLLQVDGEVCEPPDWAVDDLLTVEEALPLMTIESAYSVLRDNEIGSLKAGKLSDLIILSDNPLEVDPDAIPDIQVLMTMVGGKVEHCAEGFQALCP